uniref:Myelin and lymphocyte protein n=1 Tax=Cyprinus carpio TaxID=7962 RepID=A0A8C2FFX4_CYPCA
SFHKKFLPRLLRVHLFQVFGGLVWTLVASTKVDPANPQGWVMFVSLFCFLITTLWFFIFITGINQSSIWPSLDVGYHTFSAFFYLSAAVLLANVTIGKQGVDKIMTCFLKYLLRTIYTDHPGKKNKIK